MVTLRTTAMLSVALFVAACGSSSGAAATPVSSVPTPTFASATPARPPAGVKVSDTQMVSATSGWALTANGLFWSDDAGASWSSITPSNVTADEIAGVYFRDASEGWLVSEHVTNPGSATALPTTAIRAFRTDDSGRTWNSVPVPARSLGAPYGRAYFGFLDDRSGWLQLDVGSHAGFGHTEFFHTTDGGMTWTKLAETPVEPGPLHFLNRSDGWVAGGDFVFVTHDGGVSWQQRSWPPSAALEQLAAHSGPLSSTTDDLFVAPSLNDAGNAESLVFYETQDGARTWTPIATLAVSGSAGNVLPVALIDATHWIVGVPAAAGRTRFAITQDRGRTWDYVDSPGFAGATTLTFATPTQGWSLATFSRCRGFKSDCFYETRLYRTSDGGRSWSLSSPGS